MIERNIPHCIIIELGRNKAVNSKVTKGISIMKSFFEDLKEGFEDVIAHEQGKKTLRSHLVELPQKPADYAAKEKKENIESHHNQCSI
jgi:hypothetical protein